MILMAAFGTGFATAFSLILAIGAQNAFVLRQGLMRSQVFAVCLVCALSDAILIALGVAGFSAVVEQVPWLPKAMLYGGALFLFGYGALRIRAGLTTSQVLDTSGQAQPLRPAILTCLALTWLNPHVYLDTFGLIGAVSTQFDGTGKLAFGAGAVSSSFVFFFGLGYGARLLAPYLSSARAWSILDILIGILMWILAIGLLSAGI